LNRDFSKQEVQMAKKHTKKFSTSLAIKEMQIKSCSYSTSLLLEWLPQKTQTTNVGKTCGDKGALMHCWWEFKLVQPP
jgi:hypothetical protein